MPKPFMQWTVLAHEALNPVDQDILSAIGRIHRPIGATTRRMTVVRLRDGRLVIYSALALDEYEMTSLENFGRPAFLVVPSDHHRLDARPWKDRYPDIQVVTPEGARSQVEKTVPVDATGADFDDPDVRLLTVPGTSKNEAVLEVRRPRGTTLVLNDIVSTIPTPLGLGGQLFKLMGFAGDAPHVPLPVKMAMVDDRQALAAQLRLWAELPMLRRVLVSHGAAIEKDPRGALHSLAESLE